MRIQQPLLLLWIGCLFFLLNSCNKGRDTALSPSQENAISFIDDDGKAVSLDEKRRRIISLYSAHTENLFAIGAGNSLIGGHTTCTWPPEAASFAVYDYNGDPEYIIAAEPDLVLIRPFIRRRSPGYIAEIEKAGILVVSLYPENFEDFDGYIKKLALLTGTEEEAEQQLILFHQNLDQTSVITGIIAEKQTLFFESTEAEIRTAAAGSLPALAIEIAGGLNIAGGAKSGTPGSSIAPFGAEKLLQYADKIDAYIIQQGSMNTGNGVALSARPGYHTIKAIQNNRVFYIDEKLISSPTFRYLTGVQELAQFLYPGEKFPF
ncbi:periplasmic binding protein [Treponema primitia ZAS-2]|uniref:Periplasmic binding protein n=1 Tax=Treponema primitia (strain ATCC BAA-887 / DSM 12427 / ZAS-2) TaxID=545694 RepID=F5YLC5_TREPZ|nr:ABC transporter substrate-binding protein [Treponema primitia]AEF85422.1 periplasmic binding protein [Treponema primitia ZAS-2]